jgi:hypothetical protein
MSIVAETARQAAPPAVGTAPASSRKTLMIALYRPFSIRFVLKTGIFEALKKRTDLRVVVATHYPKTPETEVEYGGKNVVVEQLDMDALRRSQTDSKLRYLMRMVRLLTYNLRSGYVLGLRRFMAYEFRCEHPRDKMRITGRLYVAAILGLPHVLGRARWLRRLWIRIEDWRYGRDTQARLFREYRPDMVLVASLGYGYDEQIINEAKRNGAAVVTTVQSWDNTTTWGYPGGTPDHVVAWSENMRHEARDLLDIDPATVFVGGVPHWDNYFNGAPPYVAREPFLRELGLSPDRKTIYFPTSSPKVYRHHVSIARVIAAAITDGRIRHDVQLLVRPHPAYYNRNRDKWNVAIDAELAEFRGIASQSNGRVVVDDVRVKMHVGTYDIDAGEQERLKALILHSDVMVNFYSTQAVEAAILDRPIVNVSFGTCRSVDLPARVIDTWDHYTRVLDTGGVARAYSEDALIDAVNRYLDDPTLDREGRQRIVDQEIPVNRGCAGRAIGEHIISLLDGRQPGRS